MSERAYREKLTRTEMNENKRQNRVGSSCKFETLTEMKQQHAAIQTLRNNGYDPTAIQQIGKQFLDSVDFALQDYNRMRNEIKEIVENPY